MKNNKLKIIAFILVLIVLVLLVILFVVKVTNYSIKDSAYNNVNDNKTYIEHRDKHHKKAPKLKTVQADDHSIKQINTYLKNVHFNGSITVLKDGKLMLDKGYGYQNLGSKKKKQHKYDVFNWLSTKIYYWLNTQAFRIIKQNKYE